MDFTTYKEKFIKILEAVDYSEVENMIQLIFNAYKDDKCIFVIGNGGSAANASHLAQDLVKGTRFSLELDKRIKAMSLTDNIAFITALSNDDGYEVVFEQQLRTFAKPGDLLIAISGSGNSPNILKAITWAKDNNLQTLGVTGFNGGKLYEISDHNLHVPLNDMCTVESVHSVIFHYIIIELQDLVKKYNA